MLSTQSCSWFGLVFESDSVSHSVQLVQIDRGREQAPLSSPEEAFSIAKDSIRILIADKLDPAGGEYLAAQDGVVVTNQTGLGNDELVAALADHDGVVVRSAVKITADLLDAAMTIPGSRLRGIARAGVGVDNINLDSATKYGIAVMNSASASTITTAEHAFALMIALARNIAPASAVMNAGGWDRNKFVGLQLHGRTLGGVGMGRIGQTMASRALAFGMKVLGFDPFINAESALDGQVTMLGSFDDLIASVDIVSFHVPRTDQTTGMLSKTQFEKARPGLLVINASRGGIVDEKALIEALDAGICAGAAIDVYPTEPPPADDPLRTHEKVLTTPHLGASTVEAQEAVAVNACHALLTYLRGEGLEGAVNVGGLDLALSTRQRAFVDLAERMTLLLQAATNMQGLKSVRITLKGETLAGKADTIARLSLTSILNRHVEQPVTIINVSMIAEQRGITHETIIASDIGEDRLAIELTGTDSTPHRVEGAIYDDNLPRVTNLDGYALDMITSGPMVLLTNADQPGRIGLVGKIFGDAKVNIAEMVIGRKPEDSPGDVAMMILKLDASPGDDALQTLREAEGILHVAAVELSRV